jgi:hypothetical protein
MNAAASLRNVACICDRSPTFSVSLFQIDLPTGFGSITIMRSTHRVYSLLDMGSDSCGRTRDHSIRVTYYSRLRLSFVPPRWLRIAGLGDTWESILFGGGFDSIHNLCASPYGATTTQWPGPRGSMFKHTVLKISKRKYGHVRNWRTYYAVSMDWVRSLFTNAFWEDIERNGCTGLKIERKLGARLKYRVAYKWFKDEEQTPYEFIDSPRSVLSDEDEEDEEDEEGRGIIDRDDSLRHPSHKYKMEQLMRFLEDMDGIN